MFRTLYQVLAQWYYVSWIQYALRDSRRLCVISLVWGTLFLVEASPGILRHPFCCISFWKKNGFSIADMLSLSIISSSLDV